MEFNMKLENQCLKALVFEKACILFFKVNYKTSLSFSVLL